MFHSLTIRAKLIGAFALLVILSIGQGLFARSGIWGVDHDLGHVHDHTLPSVRWSGALNAATSDLRATLLRHLISAEEAAKREVEAELDKKDRDIADARREFEKLITNAEERTLYEEFSGHWDAYKQEAAVVLEHSRKYQDEAARAHYVQKARQLGRAADAALDKITELNVKDSDKSRQHADASTDLTVKVTMAMLALSTFLSVMLGFLIIRGISQGIASVTRPMDALAHGDLDVAIPHRNEKTELGTIADRVQVFKEALIAKRDADEVAAFEADAKMRRAELLDELTKRFETNVSSLTHGLSSAATEMEATAQAMTATADQTTNQSVGVASAAEQTSAPTSRRSRSQRRSCPRRSARLPSRSPSPHRSPAAPPRRPSARTPPSRRWREARRRSATWWR